MKSPLLIILLLMFSIETACSDIGTKPMPLEQNLSDTISLSDHQTLAAHYDDVANTLQAKLDRQKKMLNQYESNSYLYGRHAEDLKEHSIALVNSYERALESNRKMAEMHRHLAQ